MTGASVLGLVLAWFIWHKRKSVPAIDLSSAYEGFLMVGLGVLTLAIGAAMLFGAVWVLHTLWRLT